jgi:hypothetical protein
MLVKTNKGHYSETEAAEALGVSLDQFRNLIRKHIAERDEDINNLASASFHPSDLLVLRMLLQGVTASPGSLQI